MNRYRARFAPAAFVVASALSLGGCGDEAQTGTPLDAHGALLDAQGADPETAVALGDAGVAMRDTGVAIPDTRALRPDAGNAVRDTGAVTSDVRAAQDVRSSPTDAADARIDALPVDINPCPTNGDPCRILPFGDSITDGWGVHGGYRIDLFHRTLADKKNITFVGSLSNGPATVDGVPFPSQHEGHNGWRIDQVMGLVPSPAFDSSPHIVLLMIGTNDVLQTLDLAKAPERLGKLLDAIVAAAPNALVVVAQLTPIAGTDSFFVERDPRVVAYNEALPAQIASRRAAGKHVILVDQHTGFPLNELDDGVHPNSAGYSRMAGVWYGAIRGLLH